MNNSLRAFRYRNFRLFFTGQSISLIGTWMQAIAMSWLVYRMTGSAFLLGLTGFLSQIPILLFAPFAGWLCDRFNRKRLLLVSQVLLALQGAAMAMLTISGTIEVWHVIALSAVLGIINAADTPIRQTFLPELVTGKQDLPSAVAFTSFMQNAGRLVGPSIAGLMLTVFSEASCFIVNAISKLGVIVAILVMQVSSAPPRDPSASMLRGMRDGFAYCWNTVPIRMMLPILALTSFMIAPYQVLMPIFADEVFHGGAHTMGFLIGAAGFGGVSGGIYLASRRDVRGLTHHIVGGAALAGTALMLFSYCAHFGLSLLLMVLVGAGFMVVITSTSIILQTIVDDNKRGRVMSIYTVSFLGMAPLGNLAAGALASRAGAPLTLLLCGLCCLAGALFLLARFGELRRHIRPIYIRLGIIEK
jgi:MFS family permease